MNGQYVIPNYESASEPEPRSFEVPQVSAEEPAEVSEKYRRYKEIENSIKAMRSTATEETLPRSAKVKVLELFTATPRPLQDRLIEEESVIGGQLFARDASVLWQRFWCHDGDWFFARLNRMPNQPDTQTVIHYQIKDNSIYKFVGGREYLAGEDESEVLTSAIDTYYEKIQQKLYT